jgi:quercetin dioxygenase-like cupin family protein
MKSCVVNDLIEYSPDDRVRKKLVGSDRLLAEMVCYEPGMMTKEHIHPWQDEIFYVVEGSGTIIVDGDSIPVSQSSMVLVRARSKHGVRAADDGRLVLLFVKGPGSAAKPKE